MCDQVQQISRALEKGDFHCALSFLGLGDNSAFRFSSHGPPEIPAFSPKKPRSWSIPPTRPKIYGPPPYPAFQRRNSQNAAREEHDSLKDPGSFLDLSRIPRSVSGEMTRYPVSEPSGFFPSDETTSKEDRDEDTPTLSEQEDDDDLCPFCACAAAGDDTTDRTSKQLLFQVLKAVESKSSESSRFTDLSPKEIYSAVDVCCYPTAAILDVMFSTDTFQDSSESSELCMLCTDEHEQDSTTFIDAGSMTSMSETVLPPISRSMTLS